MKHKCVAAVPAVAVASICLAIVPGLASDHLDSPRTVADPQSDIADVFAFTSPERPGHLVVAMTVTPFASPLSMFSTRVDYIFRVRRVVATQPLTLDDAPLDIVCDFMFYGAVVFGFALAAPDNGLAAAFLLLAFIGTGGSFLAFAAMAARRKIETRSRGPKSLYYLGGLTEGTETIAFFVACCIFPGAFVPLAWIFAAACWITTATRVLSAWRMLGP